MDASKMKIDTKVFAENLSDVLQEVKNAELSLTEKEKVLDK